MTQQINILIPMSGRGQRFVDMGYKLPKPFIDVNGVPMVERVIGNFVDNFKSYPARLFFIFVIRQDMFTPDLMEIWKDILLKMRIEYTIIEEDPNIQGAASTCLKAKHLINNDSPLIIGDCDHLTLDHDWLTNSLFFFNKNKSDGGIYTFYVDKDIPKWSYSDIKGKRIVQVAEKNPISSAANTGRYYFRKGSSFVAAAEAMISKNLRVNNEFYVAPVFNELIREDKLISPFFINQFHGLGTPKDLEDYLECQQF